MNPMSELEKLKIREDMMREQCRELPDCDGWGVCEDKRTPDFNGIEFRSNGEKHYLEELFWKVEEATKEKKKHEELVAQLNDFELGSSDPVNSPSHYQGSNMEVINVIDEFCPDNYSYYMGNVIKYVLRHLNKGKPVQDLEKARWYLDKMIKDWDNE